MTGKIYCISNDINNKKYIGKTTYINIDNRMAEHLRDYKKSRNEKRPLYDAMTLYGTEHFSISLIEECDLSILNEREQYWIAFYDTYHNGYNATKGGDGKQLYDYDLFVKEYNNHMLVSEIAEKYNCSTDVVSHALQLAGINGKTNAVNKSKVKVYQYDLSGNFIQAFDSQRDAARYLISQGHNGNFTSIATNIGRVLKGTRKTANGFIWKTDNNFNK